MRTSNPPRIKRSAIAWTLAAVTVQPFLPCPAQAAEVQEPEANPKKSWDAYIPEVIKDGKVNVDARLRWEHADQDSFGGSSDPRHSDAFTVRTRLGYTTGSLYNFKSMLEFEDVSIIGSENNYNQSGLNPGAGNRTVIADPETTELNRAWIAYENWDTTAKYGRQRIILDNGRFVGNVGWRQNEQTFDGVSLKNIHLIPDTTVFYSFIHNVNRILGDDHPAGDWDSENHLINVAYDRCKYGTLTAYSYILALKNSAINSSATYGASWVGSAPICEDVTLNYRAEYAHQSDYRNNPMDYSAHYIHGSVGGAYKKINAGGGYEVLGSDKGTASFQTPLATGHAFNGWADAFLTTPADGLKDLYLWIGGTIPGEVPAKVVYHHYEAEDGSNEYGYEIDLVASRKFGKHLAVLAKYAFYEDGDDGRASREKFWLQAEFKF